MKLTTSILATALMAGGAWAQNTDAIDNARSTAKSLQQKQANDTKPAPGAPAPAVKPAIIPSSMPVSKAAAPVTKSAQTSAQNNKLQKVSVVPVADGLQVEISSTQSVTPRLSKLASPDRILVELPATVVAGSQNKVPVGSAGVKGVRIGMDGKTPPTTSVVIDLEKPLTYELTPGSAGKLIVTLHSQGAASVAKNNPVPAAKATTPAPAVKAAVAAPQSPMAAKSVAATPKVAVVKAPASKSVAPAAQPEPKQLAKAVPTVIAVPAKSAVPGKNATPAKGATPDKNSTQAKNSVPAVKAPVAEPVKAVSAPAPKPEEKKWAMSGKRDPFFSPVVQQNGSGCSTGKKCLEIGAINLRGVVKSDAGFIAVVTNNLNKAYFLRENDPVFNGYVVKITGDSVVFQETIQDKLGKSFTREVVKRIFTPAV
jgi:Tfp pilus assembly protein PilP